MEKGFKKHLDEMDEQMVRQKHGENKLAKDLKKQLDIIENKFKAQELENSKIIRQKQELEKLLAKEQNNSAALGSKLDQCLINLKSSTEREHSMHERFKRLELMQTQLVNKVKLCESLYGPGSEDEYSSQSENDYAHSEEDFKEEEESQDTIQRAWKYASEYSEPEDKDDQQAPGTFQHNSNPATLQIIPGRGGCMITCKKCGMGSTSTQDVVTHKCTPTQVLPPQEVRSFRPKVPPSQRSNHYPTTHLNMGGIYLRPPAYNASYEPIIKEWE